MNDITAQFMADLMFWSGFYALCVALAVWCLDKAWSALNPPSPEEIAAREAEHIAKQATKEYKRRNRLVRFWNF